MEVEHVRSAALPGRLVVPENGLPDLVVGECYRDVLGRPGVVADVLGGGPRQPVVGPHHTVDHEPSVGKPRPCGSGSQVESHISHANPLRTTNPKWVCRRGSGGRLDDYKQQDSQSRNIRLMHRLSTRAAMNSGDRLRARIISVYWARNGALATRILALISPDGCLPFQGDRLPLFFPMFDLRIFSMVSGLCRLPSIPPIQPTFAALILRDTAALDSSLHPLRLRPPSVRLYP